MGQQQGQGQKVVDKPKADLVSVTATVELLTPDDRAPRRVIDDMINHRRMLLGMLGYIELYLRKAGVTIKPHVNN
jgi:hypothetical protein